MARFADYGFNRSHAAAYSDIGLLGQLISKPTIHIQFTGCRAYTISDIQTRNFTRRKPAHGTSMYWDLISMKAATLYSDQETHDSLWNVCTEGSREGPAEDILNERKANGPFTHLFNITSRLNLRSINQKDSALWLRLVHWDSLAPEIDLLPTSQNQWQSITRLILNTPWNSGAQWQDRLSKNEMSLFSIDESVEMTIPPIQRSMHHGAWWDETGKRISRYLYLCIPPRWIQNLFFDHFDGSAP